jgi:TetR/AcrR family transcriptional regulator, regulator of autoinduction and epiphytic fitness
MTAKLAHDDGVEDIDPRRLRSRVRLLDAATHLLSAGGIEAVTIDAVTRMSRVARTTLYRHFGSSTELLAATFERLLPPVTPPPATGSLRDRLIELLSRQAELFEHTPIHLTTLAWVALGPIDGAPDSPQDGGRSVSALRARVLDHFRVPFDQILQSHDARTELGELDPTLALAQLVGPIVFGRLSGLRIVDHHDCVRIVDDFLVAHRPGHATSSANDTPRPGAPQKSATRPRDAVRAPG